MIKNLFFKLLDTFGATAFLRRKKKDSLTVLSLHRISDEQDYFWDPITPQSFEKLLQYVSEYYTVVSFSQLATTAPHPKPLLILSFDDGYLDFYEFALPLLKKYHLPCNHNIVNECASNNTIIWTQRLNILFNHCKDNDSLLEFELAGKQISRETFKDNWMNFYLHMYKTLLQLPFEERKNILTQKETFYNITPVTTMMNWHQVIECSDQNVEIGCHTYSHDILSSITDEDVLRKEILQAKEELETRLGKTVNILALPNGEDNDKINNLILRSGITFVLYIGNSINQYFRYDENRINKIYRVNLVQEDFAAMKLRVELFHDKIKRYV